MKNVVLAALLLLSSSLAGCISGEEEDIEADSEEPKFFGEIYWSQNGDATVFENDTIFTVWALDPDSCDEISFPVSSSTPDYLFERDGYCAFEWQFVDRDFDIQYNGDFFDFCHIFNPDYYPNMDEINLSKGLCFDLQLIDGGMISMAANGKNTYCEIFLDKINDPPMEYSESGYLDENASDWHSEFAEFVVNSEDAARELGCESITYYPAYQYVIDNEDPGICGMIWPDDPFKAAIYSFVAEYDLAYGDSVGCYYDEYNDLTYTEVAFDLENNWNRSITALEYAQKWVDDNSEYYEMQPFNLTSEFNISEGGLGWIDTPTGNETTDCGEAQNMTSEDNSSSIFEIEANPNPESPGMKCFTKYVDVFGLGVYAESGLSDAQVLHAAAVLAELLDNDEDGVADDEALLSRLQNMSAMIPMFDSEESEAAEDFMEHYTGNGVSAVLFAEEVDPSQPGHWGSDATVEEIMHTINHIGHVYVYPDAFGLEPNSSLLSDAMDEARGGQFISHPDNYPENAWYHYDDTTCDYECMAIEYIYWAQVSNMEILNDTATCDGIANEWEPCSKDLLESMDVLIYALITDPQYHLPQNAPDGVYNPTTEE